MDNFYAFELHSNHMIGVETGQEILIVGSQK